jgi:glycosyltransferase involved in cell wall biosynthesis
VNPAYQALNTTQKIETIAHLKLPQSYFLFVGSLHPRKNIKRLIASFQVFANSDTATDLVIVGSAMWDAQKFQIQEQYKNRIHFLGHIETDKLAQIMACATAFVYIPYFEGFGMPLAEAMATETPILAGNQSCLPEIAADAALYVDPYNTDDIAQGMQQLKNDVALQTALKQKGLDRVKAFDWEHAAVQVWQEIENLVS